MFSFLFIDSFFPQGFFKCRNQSIFLAKQQVCDGKIDCLQGSDELFCFNLNFKNMNKKCYFPLPFYLKCYNIQNDLNENLLEIFDLLEAKNFLYRISVNGNILLKNEYKILNIKVLEIQNNFLFEKWKIKIVKNLFFLKIYNSSLNENHEMFTIENDFLMLQYLNISKNPVYSLKFLKFLKLKYLISFDCSETKLNFVKDEYFVEMTRLEKFKMENVTLIEIFGNLFKSIHNLKFLNLNGSMFPTKYIGNFLIRSSLLERIDSTKFQLCCLAWEIYKKSFKSIDCYPHPTGFFTCHNLIPSTILRFTFWMIGIVGLLGNCFAIFRLLFSKKQSKLYRFFLSLSDLFTSVIILIIAAADVALSGQKYFKEEENWRTFWTCPLLRSIMTFSLLLSSFSILFITMERYETVHKPLKQPFFKRNSILISMITLLILSIISIIPLISFKVS